MFCMGSVSTFGCHCGSSVYLGNLILPAIIEWVWIEHKNSSIWSSFWHYRKLCYWRECCKGTWPCSPEILGHNSTHQTKLQCMECLLFCVFWGTGILLYWKMELTSNCSPDFWLCKRNWDHEEHESRWICGLHKEVCYIVEYCRFKTYVLVFQTVLMIISGRVVVSQEELRHTGV